MGVLMGPGHCKLYLSSNSAENGTLSAVIRTLGIGDERYRYWGEKEHKVGQVGSIYLNTWLLSLILFIRLTIPATSGAQRLWYEFTKKLLACGLAGPSLDPSYELPIVVEHTGRSIESSNILEYLSEDISKETC
ncbi:hypothetical protein STEG23_032597, partial [Scotinomys teguina]